MHIAVVEDQPEVRTCLAEYIERYFAENGTHYRLTMFSDGDEILEDYRADYDLILMDIQMARMDGLRAAEKIRQLDEDVYLVFVTNLRNYAIKGYSVQAMDFLLKPVNYNMLQRILKRVEKLRARRTQKCVALPTEQGITRIEVGQLRYVSTFGRDGHILIYHMERGDYQCRQTMKSAETDLLPHSFYRCNSCYLVNLACVRTVSRDSVLLTSGEELGISRARYKGFMEALTAYLRGER